MSIILVFAIIYAAMVAMSFWEAYVEKRSAWDKDKAGWKIRIGKYALSAYHFYIFWVMWPLLLILPLVICGFDKRLFGVLISAYFSGMIIEDFMWYVVNPAVKLKEFYTEFSDYYPWLKIRNKKIIPLGYIIAAAISVASWAMLWK